MIIVKGYTYFNYYTKTKIKSKIGNAVACTLIKMFQFMDFMIYLKSSETTIIIKKERKVKNSSAMIFTKSRKFKCN